MKDYRKKNYNFILDLDLMCDALQELSDLSLQDRDMDLYRANKKMEAILQFFMKDEWFRDHITKMSLKLLKICDFRGILFMGKIT